MCNKQSLKCTLTLKWPFISLLLLLLYLQMQFFKSILLRFEVYYKCTFNRIKRISFSQGCSYKCVFRRSDVITSQYFLCAGCGTEVEPSE